MLIQENLANLAECKKYGLEYALIDDDYEITWKPQFESSVL